MGAQGSKQAARKFPTKIPPATTTLSQTASAPSPVSRPPPAPRDHTAPVLPGDEKATVDEADPRKQDQKVLENWNRISLNINDSRNQFKKDNEMLSILRRRQQLHPNISPHDPFPVKELVPTRTSTSLTPSQTEPSRLSTDDLNTLLLLKRSDPQNWTAERLADRFEVDPEVVKVVLKFWQTPETVSGVSGQDINRGVWVDDMIAWRRREFQEATDKESPAGEWDTPQKWS
ncbi:hypothetical protein HDV00_004797 [Rhizophlyctis rosea]|nr:hypothetical protein HDV00_004797 [Rhizophlyctis rosea]